MVLGLLRGMEINSCRLDTKVDCTIIDCLYENRPIKEAYLFSKQINRAISPNVVSQLLSWVVQFRLVELTEWGISPDVEECSLQRKEGNEAPGY